MSETPDVQQSPEHALAAMEKAVRDALLAAPADQVRERLNALRPEIDAAEHPLRMARLSQLVDELNEKFGPVPAELLEQAAREWPDYEEE